MSTNLAYVTTLKPYRVQVVKSKSSKWIPNESFSARETRNKFRVLFFSPPFFVLPKKEENRFHRCYAWETRCWVPSNRWTSSIENHSFDKRVHKSVCYTINLSPKKDGCLVIVVASHAHLHVRVRVTRVIYNRTKYDRKLETVSWMSTRYNRSNETRDRCLCPSVDSSPPPPRQWEDSFAERIEEVGWRGR